MWQGFSVREGLWLVFRSSWGNLNARGGFERRDPLAQGFKKNLRQSLRPNSSMKMRETEEEEEERTYESFEVVDGNVEQLLTKNFGRARLRGH